jgi:hypothetical protein
LISGVQAKSIFPHYFVIKRLDEQATLPDTEITGNQPAAVMAAFFGA